MKPAKEDAAKKTRDFKDKNLPLHVWSYIQVQFDESKNQGSVKIPRAC